MLTELATVGCGVDTGSLIVGALPKPDVPEGPVRELFDNLHALHHRAGWPSLRVMAREVGCSHTTLSVAFSSPALPRWGLLELIVETLGGDTERFHKLWLAASEPAAAPSPAADRIDVPRHLPADVRAFTGREGDLARLDALLTEAAVVVISGTAGVGKTALTVRWAHRVADRFPDGQLYVNLRGYDPDRPVPPAEALGLFLRELGVPATEIPGGLGERAARFRTLLADRKVLVLLDNAHSVDQVRDLLPGSASCFVAVTSRDSLAGLVARYGAVRLPLDLLPLGESITLLRTLIGSRVDEQPEAAFALATRCARLPLALRVAAELAASRPALTLTSLVAELGDERRLDLLDAGDDEYTAVRMVFSWSLKHLPPGGVGVFRLLGLYAGRTIDVAGIAALAGTDETSAHRLIAALLRAHLVEETAPGRFGMHDLLRAYAAERAGELTAEECRAAIARLFAHFLDAVPAAVEARATDWLQAERPNLLEFASRHASAWPSEVSRLAVTYGRYLDAAGYYHDSLAMHGHGLAAARAAGRGLAVALRLSGTAYRRLGRYPEAAEHYRLALEAGDKDAGPDEAAQARHGLGIVSWRLGRYAEALEHLEAALALYRTSGNRAGEGSARHSLGIVNRRLGRHRAAVEHYLRATEIQREIGNRVGEASAAGNLGVVYVRLGAYADALAQHHRSLSVHRETGDRAAVAVALTNLGMVYERLGRYAEAQDHATEAYAICREIGYRVGQGDALHVLGTALAGLGHLDEAVERLREAVALGREIGEAELVASASNDRGAALRAQGRAEAADAEYSAALALAGEIGDRYEEARALAGLAALRPDRALGERALALFEELEAPEARALRDRGH